MKLTIVSLAIQQLSLKSRSPMIKFIGARILRPNYDPRVAPSSGTSVKRAANKSFDFEWELPQHYRRRELSEEEIEVLNSGGIYGRNLRAMTVDQQRVAELHSLFLCLIQSCVGQAHVSELHSLTQYIESLYTSAMESCPAIYTFISSPLSTPTRNAAERRPSKAKKSMSPKRKPKFTGVNSRPAASGATSTLGNSAKSQDDILRQLFKAVELSPDDAVTILLCRLLQGYVTFCKPTINQKRLRRMIRLDGANYFLRAIRLQLADSNPSPTRILAVDALARAFMIISGKDRKLTLKVRLSGILPQLANRILEADRLFTTVTLLRLASRCLRSARNAQIIGREKRFAERFVAILNAFTALMVLPAIFSHNHHQHTAISARSSMSIASSSSHFASTVLAASGRNGFSLSELPSASVLLRCKTNLHAEEPVNPLKMARLVEVLFFTAKNKHNKSQLLQNDALSVLKTILENHFERRHIDSIHLEISLITVSTIRQFSKTAKGMEQLHKLSIQTMCERYIGLLTEDRQRLSDRPKTLVLYTQLQDSLCALCLRCLPQIPFPMDGASFPLRFPLPDDLGDSEENTANTLPTAETSIKRVSSFRQPKFQKEMPSSSKSPDKQQTDEAASSDEDGICDEEEEDSLFIFNATGEGTSTSLLEANDIEANYSDDDDGAAPNAEEDEKVDPAYVVANYSRQNVTDLKANYRQHFVEFEHDAITTGDSSPKLRKTVSGSRSDGQIGPTHNNAVRRSPSIVTTARQATDYSSHRETIIEMANRTKSVGQFVKIAYPELVDVGELAMELQPLLSPTDSMREMITSEVTRSRLQAKFAPNVVYDLDQLLLEGSSSVSCPPALTNDDLQRVGRCSKDVFHLRFESRFESGNLRYAIQVAPAHYELVIAPDINASRPHYQWFYFEVSNNEANVPYTFEIINCRKNASMFSRGMQPVLFSVTEASHGNAGWVRAADSVCYYRNLYTTGDTEDERLADEMGESKKAASSRQKSVDQNTGKSDGKTSKSERNSEIKNYFSIRFTLSFRHAADVCYIAYHFPYTYSYLNATLEQVISRCSPTATSNNLYVHSGVLTKTLSDNTVRVVTITAPGSVREMNDRRTVLFSSRVHPGESNSSWIMHGIIKYLTSPAAAKVREMFVFKLVPMLNPDGVINGSHRCSLAGVDLNRVYSRPSEKLHPTIFHTKGLIQYMVEVAQKRPFVFVDLHGHSRKFNIFVYGNNPEESWRTADHSIEHNNRFLMLPEALERTAPAFNGRDCRYAVTKTKEFSARIAMWRQFGIERAYTMEATYCGFDTGSYVGKQITVANLMEMGAKLCESLVHLKSDDDSFAGAAKPPLSQPSLLTTRGPVTRLSTKLSAVDATNILVKKVGGSSSSKESRSSSSTSPMEISGSKLTPKEHKSSKM